MSPRFVQQVFYPVTPRAELVESVVFGKQFGSKGSSGMTGRILFEDKNPRKSVAGCNQ